MAQTTKEKLLTAARKTFHDKGFHNSTVEDIIYEAGLARGTFYIYFKNKEDIFEHLLKQVVEEMSEHASSRYDQVSTYEKILQANESYLKLYLNNRDILATFHELSTTNERFRELLKDIFYRFSQRIEGRITKDAKNNKCRENIDPPITSYALMVMIHWFAYMWFFLEAPFEGQPYDFDKVVKELTTIWYNAIYVK